MKKLLAVLVLALPTMRAAAEEIELDVFGKVKVIDVVDCARKDHRFTEFPEGGSVVTNILGRECRLMPIMPEEGSFFAWRLGEGKGLKANGSYVIVMEYPEDESRNYIIHNRATNSKRSFCTGRCSIDSWNPKYVYNNPESFDYPLSGKWERWICYTSLHDLTEDLNGERHVVWQSPGVPKRNEKGDIIVERVMHKPEDGFDFALAQYGRIHEPLANGIAVARIILCEIPDETAVYAQIKYPPQGLPRRHLFWREEMADGGPLDDSNPQCADRMSWFRHKSRQMKMMGMNTYCKDLLEFGHVQHWDPDYIRPGWAWHAATRWLWANVVPYMAKEGHYILPYYEWCGNIGWDGAKPPPLGPQKRAKPLNRRDNNYTQIGWTEKANIDITDPEALQVTKELLDGTILRFKDELKSFAGAYFRTRPANWPIGFGEDTLARFQRERDGQVNDEALFGNRSKAVTANSKRPKFSDVMDADDLTGVSVDSTAVDKASYGQRITKDVIRHNGKIRAQYIRWWNRKRAQFVQNLRDYLVEKGIPEAQVIFESDVSEPGSGMEGGGLLTDSPAFWKKLLAKPPFNCKDYKCVTLAESVEKHLYLKQRRRAAETWKDYEWQYACPGDDPETYNTKTNIFLAMPINRMFSVCDRDAFKAYVNHDGVNTVIRHYPLNENMLYRYNPVSGDENCILGYAIHDTERAGRASMQIEVAAMAHGDPVNIGYLIGSTFSRGFPGPVREFNLNYLALPAVKSTLVNKACENPDVVLREIDCRKLKAGRYFYIAHLGFRPVENVKVRFPAGVSQVTEIVSGRKHKVESNRMVVFPRLDAWQLISFVQ